MATNNVQINLDFPAGISVGGDFAGAYAAGVTSSAAGPSASSVTVLSTDSTGGPPDWHLRFQNSGNPNYRTSIRMAILAGPLTFTVASTALSTEVFTQDANWTAAFPNGIPTGTQVTVAGGSLPAGLAAGTYYVVSTALGSVSLSATVGGSAVTCTSAGTGTMTVTAYNYSSLLTAYNARVTTNPASLPYPTGTATAGFEIQADDKGNPVWIAPNTFNDQYIQPSDVGFITWTAPPYLNTTTFTLRNTDGWLYLWKFKSGNGGIVNTITYAVVTAAAGTAMANCFVGIYDDLGNLLGSCSVDQTANLAGTGVKTAALSAPVYLAPNTVYRLGLVIGTHAGTTQPGLAGNAANSSGAYNNLGKATFATMVACGQQNAFTALPNPVTTGSQGQLAGLPVFGLS